MPTELSKLAKRGRYTNGDRVMTPMFLKGSLPLTSTNTVKTLQRDKTDMIKRCGR
jgi:hypothetical protein